jgi:glycosyltransferase involved in cell wall biosynthesis
VFTYLPTHNALRLIELLRGPGSIVVYYCVADFSQLSDLGAAIFDIEAELARKADLVFVQGPAFAKRLAGLNPRIHEFKSGVNLELFDAARGYEPAGELAGRPRPIVGYTGGIHRHVDLGLVRHLARALPDATIALVGPTQTDMAAVAAEPNVVVLPARPIAEIPALIRSFDVGIIPYARTAYTETVYPTKLYEYLAMGIPVVATALPELARLELPRAALRLAADGDEFVAAVRDALARHDPLTADDRVRLAETHDWGVIVHRMAELIAERAGEKEAGAP